MKRVGYAIIVLSVLFAGAVYAQSLAEIREKAKAEVRSEMGIDNRQAPVQRSGDSKTSIVISPELTMLQKVALIGIVIALIPAIIARMKGRSFIAWWVLGLIAFIVVFPISVYMKKIPRPGKVARKKKDIPEQQSPGKQVEVDGKVER